MKKIILLLPIVFLICLLLSCHKEKTEINIYSANSELWIKVGDSIPNFNIKFTCEDVKNNKKDYRISFLDNVFTPNLGVFTDSYTNETWVLTLSSYYRSNEITLETEDGNTYTTRGFEFGEKRFVQIIRNINGSVDVKDIDISTINRDIYIN